MSPSVYYRVNEPHVIHETIDDEAVLINLTTGCYYSLNPVATRVWNLVEHSARLDEILADLTGSYNGASGDIEGGVSRLLSDLEAEDLIVEIPAPSAGQEPQSNGSREVVPPGVNGAAEKPAFVLPTLQKYTDMQELIMLDPIHEADDSGWPHRRVEADI